MTVIGETGCHAFEQSNLASPLAQQQNAGIQGNLSAIESAKDNPGSIVRKPHLQKISCKFAPREKPPYHIEYTQ
jgi:hypothetical protein